MAAQRWFYLKCGVIRDFCSYRVRQAPVAGTCNTHVGLRSTTLAAGRVFTCDIESALPYSGVG